MCFLNYLFEKTINFLKNLPSLINEYLPNFQEEAKKIAKVISKHKTLFVLGKGFGEAIAR